MSKTQDLTSRTFSIQRTFKAPVQLVWEAWTKAEHIANWWGPKGMELTIVEHEFKVGGQWKYTMLMPNGNEFVSDGVYAEIVELQKILTSANFRPMTVGVDMEMLFEAVGDQTNFTLNVIHPTEEYKTQQEQMGAEKGWSAVFDRLEELLVVQQA